MLARWIATVAALLLACAQAGAHVRTESSVGVVNLDHVTAPLGELAQQPKTALPARASLGELAPGENPHATHCHAWQKSFSPDYSTSGTTIWRWDSAPFGETAANEQPTAGLPAFTLNLRFPGQQYDRETGTYYNYFRDYEAGTGRYVQSDPIGLHGGLNTFAYAYSSPLELTDPYGLNVISRGLANMARGIRDMVDPRKKSTVAIARVCNSRGRVRYVGAANTSAPALGNPPSGVTWLPRGSGGGEHAEANLINGLDPDEFITELGTSTGICPGCAGQLRRSNLRLTGTPNRDGRYYEAVRDE